VAEAAALGHEVEWLLVGGRRCLLGGGDRLHTGARRGPSPAQLPAPAVEPVVRRLTLKQYQNTITDIFGPGLTFPPLDEEPGTGGFSTTGAAEVATSFQAVEQYMTAADALARQVFADEARRCGVVGCVPRTATHPHLAARARGRRQRLPPAAHPRARPAPPSPRSASTRVA
jgi:hypothetical protein